MQREGGIATRLRTGTIQPRKRYASPEWDTDEEYDAPPASRARTEPSMLDALAHAAGTTPEKTADLPPKKKKNIFTTAAMYGLHATPGVKRELRKTDSVSLDACDAFFSMCQRCRTRKVVFPRKKAYALCPLIYRRFHAQEVAECAKLLGLPDRVMELVDRMNVNRLKHAVSENTGGESYRLSSRVALALHSLAAEGAPIFAFDIEHLVLSAFMSPSEFQKDMEEMAPISYLANALHEAVNDL